MRKLVAMTAIGMFTAMGAVTHAQEATDQQAAAGAASASAEAGLQVAEKQPFGKMLTDAQGRALYMFTADKKDAKESACKDACAEAWPPFTAQGEPNLGPDVDKSLVTTFQREDGKTQVSYAGYPLYYFAKDSGPGQVSGQDKKGFGGEWYVMGPQGKAVKTEQKAGMEGKSDSRD